MLKIRRPLGRLIFNMGIAIPGKTVFLIETATWSIVERVKFSVYNMVYKSLYLLLRDEQLHAKGQAKYHYNKCSWLESFLDSNNWECKLLLHVINVCSGHIYLSMLQHNNMNENASFVWYMFNITVTNSILHLSLHVNIHFQKQCNITFSMTEVYVRCNCYSLALCMHISIYV